jgi:hypothetical protein
VVTLSCGHHFHSKQQIEDDPICMDHWAFDSELNEHMPFNYCPVCIKVISGNRKGECFLLPDKRSAEEQSKARKSERYVVDSCTT